MLIFFVLHRGFQDLAVSGLLDLLEAALFVGRDFDIPDIEVFREGAEPPPDQLLETFETVSRELSWISTAPARNTTEIITRTVRDDSDWALFEIYALFEHFLDDPHYGSVTSTGYDSNLGLFEGLDLF